jgi:hypothetical protein
MPGLSLSGRAWLGIPALAAGLAACDTTPSPPAMSPLTVARYYGYTDVPLGDARYQVSYVGPYRRSLRSPGPVQETSAAQRTMVYDFALWRAAQLAEAQGLPGIRISNVRSNVNTYSDSYYDTVYGPGFYPYGGYPFGPRWGGPYWGPSPYVYQQAEVMLDAQLLRSPVGGDYIASDVIDQLRQTYPGAEGLPAQAPANPAPPEAAPATSQAPTSSAPAVSVQN